MLLEIIIAIFIGCIFGVVTGITPGLHINLVSAILFSLASIIAGYANIISIVAFIIAMSITHTFSDFISAIYLGAPSDDTALSVLPGHKMLLTGMGHEAVKLTVIGSLIGLISVITLSPILLFIVPFIFKNVSKYIGWILLAVVIFMILRDKSSNKKFWNFIAFMLAGILGLIALNMSALKDPLLPMLSGLFGISMLAMSLSEKVILPVQRTTEMVAIKPKETAKALGSGIFSGSLVSIFPGLGPAQAAVISIQIVKKISTTSSLILLGSINTVSMILSLITLFTIGKARNGSIVVVQKLIGSINLNVFILFLTIALIAGCIATMLTLRVSRIFSHIMNKIDYNFVSLAVIIFIAMLVLYFSGFIGILILAIATSIGLIPAITKINRSNLMGCLLLPIIIYYLF